MITVECVGKNIKYRAIGVSAVESNAGGVVSVDVVEKLAAIGLYWKWWSIFQV